MRKNLLATAAVVALLAPGLAKSDTATPTTDTEAATTVMPDTGMLAGMTADEIIGRDVVDIAGNNVGSVGDLLLGADGQITHVMVDVGGFLGIGARTVALDVGSLTAEQGDGGDFVVALTRDQIEALPEYERQNDTWVPRS
jgi:sporulation protein YlmC with PRC-barrel domain